jgi:hypothetical protein
VLRCVQPVAEIVRCEAVQQATVAYSRIPAVAPAGLFSVKVVPDPVAVYGVAAPS